MKVLVGAFNQEKALVGAFSVIVKTGCGTDRSICGTISCPGQVVHDEVFFLEGILLHPIVRCHDDLLVGDVGEVLHGAAATVFSSLFAYQVIFLFDEMLKSIINYSYILKAI